MFYAPQSKLKASQRTSALLLAACSLMAMQQSHALETNNAGSGDRLPLVENLSCLSDSELASYRGGFISDGGIVIGFGFERIVTIDGEIQEHVTASLPVLNVGNNIQIVPINRVLDVDNEAISREGLIQWAQGLGGSYTTAHNSQPVSSSEELNQIMTNVIQNQLDQKTIEQIRAVNIELYGLGAIPGIEPQRDINPNLFESLNQ